MVQTRDLSELTRNMIIAYLQTGMTAALASIRANRPNALVTTENPREYFIYPKAKGYTPPAVFVIIEDFNFKPAERGANHINATVRTNVAILIEDKDLMRLTIKADRYMDALHLLLAQAELYDSTHNVKLVIVVQRAEFSPEYTNAGEDPQGLFRKEVRLECDIEYYANY